MSSQDTQTPSKILKGFSTKKPANSEEALRKALDAVNQVVMQNRSVPISQLNGLDAASVVTSAIEYMSGKQEYRKHLAVLSDANCSGNRQQRFVQAVGQSKNRAIVASTVVGSNRAQRKAFMNAWQANNGTKPANVGKKPSIESARQQLERVYEQNGNAPSASITVKNVSLETAAQMLALAQREAASKRLASSAPASTRGNDNGNHAQGKDARKLAGVIAQG